MSSYKTVIGYAEYTFTDRGSKFIAYAKGIKCKEDCDEYVKELKKIHPKSRHVCYAYILESEDNYRINDDGEPSGSAGLPILGQLRSFQLKYTIVAVVRYFGGTLLGVTGLINAYKNSTAMALQLAKIETLEEMITHQFFFEYHLMDTMMQQIKKMEIQILERTYLDRGTELTVAINEENNHEFLDFLQTNINYNP